MTVTIIAAVWVWAAVAAVALWFRARRDLPPGEVRNAVMVDGMTVLLMAVVIVLVTMYGCQRITA